LTIDRRNYLNLQNISRSKPFSINLISKFL
jgi:hypothetical protein